MITAPAVQCTMSPYDDSSLSKCNISRPRLRISWSRTAAEQSDLTEVFHTLAVCAYVYIYIYVLYTHIFPYSSPKEASYTFASPKERLDWEQGHVSRPTLFIGLHCHLDLQLLKPACHFLLAGLTLLILLGIAARKSQSRTEGRQGGACPLASAGQPPASVVFWLGAGIHTLASLRIDVVHRDSGLFCHLALISLNFILRGCMFTIAGIACPSNKPSNNVPRLQLQLPQPVCPPLQQPSHQSPFQACQQVLLPRKKSQSHSSYCAPHEHATAEEAGGFLLAGGTDSSATVPAPPLGRSSSTSSNQSSSLHTPRSTMLTIRGLSSLQMSYVGSPSHFST